MLCNEKQKFSTMFECIHNNFLSEIETLEEIPWKYRNNLFWMEIPIVKTQAKKSDDQVVCVFILWASIKDVVNFRSASNDHLKMDRNFYSGFVIKDFKGYPIISWYIYLVDSPSIANNDLHIFTNRINKFFCLIVTTYLSRLNSNR